MKKCISVLCIVAPCWVSGKIWWIKDILSVNDPEKISFTAVQLQNRNKWCQGQLKGQRQKTMIQFNCYQQYISFYEVWWKYIAVLMRVKCSVWRMDRRKSENHYWFKKKLHVKIECYIIRYWILNFFKRHNIPKFLWENFKPNVML